MPNKSSNPRLFAPRAIDLVVLDEALHVLGDISPATFYRGIKSGRFPAPVKVGPNTSRWNRAELEECVQQLAEQASAHRSDVAADGQPLPQRK